MFDERRRPQGRLFYLLACVLLWGTGVWGQTPSTTTISDTVYRADGSVAGGTLLISWPTFSTSAGQAVAAGRKSVTLGPGGALSVALVPNTGSLPAGTYYTVVYQLDDGTVKTEFWIVTAASPATISSVRTILGSGNSAVTTSGSGSFVSKAGDTMTGALQLPGDPVAPNQASTKHYVDSGLAVKADVIAGVVPSGQLGNGTTNNSLCLHGDSNWGPCGGSSNAVSIQNVPVGTTPPTDNQVITYVASTGTYQPRAGSGVTAGMSAVKYSPDFNWSQSPSTSLSSPGPKTVNLAACVPGVLAAEPQYYVYVAGTGTAEAVLVTGGTCHGDGAAGTLQFTTVNAHPSGYTVGSASGGIQEAIVGARFTPTDPTGTPQSGKVIVPPGEYKAFARISVRASNMTVDFTGSIVECRMNDTCIFVGDGLSLKFYLSQTPFSRPGRTLLDEEYSGTALNPTRWNAIDPAGALTVSNGTLQVSGGTGVDRQSIMVFAEKVELGGALVLQHGDMAFGAASDGVLGGLYPNTVSVAGCLAGFRVTPNGGESTIRALVNGAVTGSTINTVSGHRYALTTRFYATEIYRRRQIFHSAGHPAGSGFGGGAVAADLRVVLEVHATDPTNPATLIASSTVLYDGVISNVSGFCTYALVNSLNLHCTILFTRMLQPVDAEVRSALPGQSYRTRLVGSQTEGAECIILAASALQFFPENAPASNELIAVHYRGLGRALARVTDPARIAAEKNGSDDGVRGSVREVKTPAPRTSADCENAALALLDDAGGSSWSGEYVAWSDFLPGGAQDIFPVQVSAASRSAAFQATVREVEIEIKDLRGEHSLYKVRFADDVAAPLAFEFQTGSVVLPLSLTAITTAQVGTSFLPDLTAAEITQATSTSVNVDAGVAPITGGGIEVRWTDFGWGQENDRNLAGRFSTQTFTLTRLGVATNNYFLRQFDNSTPPRYSRYTTALHLKYPL